MTTTSFKILHPRLQICSAAWFFSSFLVHQAPFKHRTHHHFCTSSATITKVPNQAGFKAVIPISQKDLGVWANQSSWSPEHYPNDRGYIQLSEYRNCSHDIFPCSTPLKADVHTLSFTHAPAEKPPVTIDLQTGICISGLPFLTDLAAFFFFFQSTEYNHLQGLKGLVLLLNFNYGNFPTYGKEEKQYKDPLCFTTSSTTNILPVLSIESI